MPPRKRKRKLKKVKQGCTLYWPRFNKVEQRKLIRGGGGYCVWDDDPLISTAGIPSEIKALHGIRRDECQLWKLADAGSGDEPSPNDNAGANNLYRDLGYTGYDYRPNTEDIEVDAHYGRVRDVPNSQATEVAVPIPDEVT